MYLEVAERLKQALRGAVHDRYGVELTQIAAEAPPRPALGDIAFPVALGLAKQGHGPKAAAHVSVGVRCPFLGFDANGLPKPSLRKRHPLPR